MFETGKCFTCFNKQRFRTVCFSGLGLPFIITFVPCQPCLSSYISCVWAFIKKSQGNNLPLFCRDPSMAASDVHMLVSFSVLKFGILKVFLQSVGSSFKLCNNQTLCFPPSWPLTSPWRNENMLVCQETLFPCSLNNWASEGLDGSLTHILSLSSAHVLKVWTRWHVDTNYVVVTTCCVERRHKVYCPEPRFTDVLKKTHFIDLAHARRRGWVETTWQPVPLSPNQVLLVYLWTKSKRLFCVFVSLSWCWLWTYLAFVLSTDCNPVRLNNCVMPTGSKRGFYNLNGKISWSVSERKGETVSWWVD